MFSVCVFRLVIVSFMTPLYIHIYIKETITSLISNILHAVYKIWA